MNYLQPALKVDGTVLSRDEEGHYTLAVSTKSGTVVLDFSEAAWQKLADTAAWFRYRTGKAGK